MDTIRALVEGFLRGRYGLGELARLLSSASLGYPALRVAAILVVGWLLVVPVGFAMLTIPRFTTEGPVVRNGVAVVVVCGEKQRGFAQGLMAVGKYAPEPRTGGWWPARRGECTVWYHRPPDPTQRFNRQLRSRAALSS